MITVENMKDAGQKKPLFTFVAFKGYAVFLLQNKIEELARLNLQLADSLDLPLLKLFSQLSEEQLLEVSIKDYHGFLEEALNDTAMEQAREAVFQWKEDRVDFGINREKIQLEDLVLGYSIRKQVLHRFLPEYTTDCQQLLHIIQEIESFYTQLEKLAVETFVDIQQEELFIKNQFLSSLIHHSVDGVLAFDTDLLVTEWNPSLENTLHIRKEEILGKSLLDFFPELNDSSVMLAFTEALNGNHTHLPNSSYTSREGYYEANVTPIYSENGHITGGLAVIHDITSRVAAEELLREHQEELQTANEELTEQREELQAANEELMEQREELQAANEELTEQREEIEAVNEELQESLAQLEEAQEALQLSINQLEEAQSIAHLGSFEYHINNNYIVCSREMKRILKLKDDTLPLEYEAYFSLVHPDDKEMFKSAVIQAAQDGQAYSFEHRIIRPGGDVRWLLANGRPVVSNHSVYKIQGTVLDITERKLADIELLEKQYFIEKITDTTPDVITVFDLEKSTNIYANRELNSILGYSIEEFHKLRQEKDFIQKLVHPDDMEEGMRFLQEFAQYTGSAPREIEYRIRKKSGHYIWVSARYNVFRRNAKGLPVQIISLTRDINQRKLAEEELKQTIFKLHDTNNELVRAEELLKEANSDLENQVSKRTVELQRKNSQLLRINSDLDNFIYTASHDLKVPIVNLEGLLILLNKKLNDKLEEKDKNLLGMMQTSIERFKKTIQDLSDLTKMQKDLDDESRDIVDLPLLLEDIKGDLAQLMEEKQAEIKLNLSINEVPFDRKNLRSIFYNLITNGIKYSSEERRPVVEISAEKLPKGYLMCIKDNGQGIPENQREKIFSLFKRLHKDIEGSGMGLYIVKRIIDNNGGRIEVESELGQGTTFKIFLQND